MGCWRGFGLKWTRKVRMANRDEVIVAYTMAEEDDPGDRYLELTDCDGGVVRLRRAHLDWLIRELPDMRAQLYRGPLLAAQETTQTGGEG